MSLESAIVGALTSLVQGRVYPDIAPQGVTALPRITYQQVGGDADNFLEGAPGPNKHHARMQVNVWAATRLAASALAHQVEDALRATTALQVTVLGALVSIYEPETNLYGTRQDFDTFY